MSAASHHTLSNIAAYNDYILVIYIKALKTKKSYEHAGVSFPGIVAPQEDVPTVRKDTYNRG